MSCACRAEHSIAPRLGLLPSRTACVDKRHQPRSHDTVIARTPADFKAASPSFDASSAHSGTSARISTCHLSQYRRRSGPRHIA